MSQNEIFLTKSLSIKIERHSKFITLEGLYFNSVLILYDWLKIVDFVEYFQAFQKNHLLSNHTYSIDNTIEFELTKQDERVLLSMLISGQWIHFDKLKAAQMSQKINRVLARCDLLINME